MSWNASNFMDQRVSFISACLAGEMSMSELCALYSISRVAGYKWLCRYREGGVGALCDRSSAPHVHGRQTPVAFAEALAIAAELGTEEAGRLAL